MQTTQTTQGNTNVARRKSVALTPDEKRSLKAFIKSFNTKTEAAEAIPVSRQVLERVNLVGSGRPDNITKIREKLNAV